MTQHDNRPILVVGFKNDKTDQGSSRVCAGLRAVGVRFPRQFQKPEYVSVTFDNQIVDKIVADCGGLPKSGVPYYSQVPNTMDLRRVVIDKMNVTEDPWALHSHNLHLIYEPFMRAFPHARWVIALGDVSSVPPEHLRRVEDLAAATGAFTIDTSLVAPPKNMAKAKKDAYRAQVKKEWSAIGTGGEFADFWDAFSGPSS